MEKWYLRSFKDGDAHFGRVNEDATVTPRCGLTFLPEHRLFGEGPAFIQPPVDPLQACPECRTAEMTTEDPDGVAVRGLVDALSSPRSQRPPRKRFRFWSNRMEPTMSEESAPMQPEQSGQDDASLPDVGNHERAELAKCLEDALDVRSELSAALDDLVRQAATALRVGTGIHVVHGTDPCTDPQCTIENEHGHSCPRCGPGTYGIIADLDG